MQLLEGILVPVRVRILIPLVGLIALPLMIFYMLEWHMVNLAVYMKGLHTLYFGYTIHGVMIVFLILK